MWIAMIFIVCLTKNILDIILASHLLFIMIFVDRPNAEKCFVESEFFDICSDSLHCIFSVFCMTAHGQLHGFFFRGDPWRIISVFFSDRKWKNWRRCNVKFLIIYGVSSWQLFWNVVGRLMIITSKFCGVHHKEFSWYCTLRLTHKYVQICFLRTLIAVFITWGSRKRVNYHGILLGFSLANFLSIMPNASKLIAPISFHTHRWEITQLFMSLEFLVLVS